MKFKSQIIVNTNESVEQLFGWNFCFCFPIDYFIINILFISKKNRIHLLNDTCNVCHMTTTTIIIIIIIIRIAIRLLGRSITNNVCLCVCMYVQFVNLNKGQFFFVFLISRNWLITFSISSCYFFYIHSVITIQILIHIK